MAATPDESTILIAEDQEHVREALAMLLRGHDYSVTLCASPNEALAAARQNAPDLAMVDMNYQRDSTSGLEGLELIQRLRELDGTVPIIALTAWGNVDLAVSAMKHGASDFIEKPWRNDALLEKVRSLTRRVQEIRSSQRVSDMSATTRSSCRRASCPSATWSRRESNSLATAFPQEWWAATTSVYGNWRRTCCTSASPMFPARARLAR